MIYVLFILSIIYNYIRERDKQKYVREHTVIIKEKKWLKCTIQADLYALNAWRKICLLYDWKADGRNIILKI